MYAFPPIEKLMFLLEGDTELSQIRLGLCDIQFLLRNGCEVHSQWTIVDVAPDGAVSRFDKEENWNTAGPITFNRLLDKPLTAVDRDELALTLTFGDAGAIVFHSDVGPYEAGQVSGPAGQFIVF